MYKLLQRFKNSREKQAKNLIAQESFLYVQSIEYIDVVDGSKTTFEI